MNLIDKKWRPLVIHSLYHWISIILISYMKFNGNISYFLYIMMPDLI